MRNALLALVAAAGATATVTSCTYRTALDTHPRSGGVPGAGGSLGTGGIGATGGTTAAGGTTGAGGATSAGSATATVGPCDAFAASKTPCVAAHSTVRALYGAYGGNLYRVERSDGTSKDIGLLAPGGFARSADQDVFCGASACSISIIYDQSGNGSHLTYAANNGERAGSRPADAKALSITLGGHKVYGVHLPPGAGYAYDVYTRGSARNVAMGDMPETIYMVASGDYYNGGCCFEYGNVETPITNDHQAATEAVYFGDCATSGKGSGSGPWVMADLGGGRWAGDTPTYAGNTSVSYKFVTAMVKGDSGNHWAIKAGDAQAGGLTTMFNGARPATLPTLMAKQGAIVLNIVGELDNPGEGNFFEGVMTAGYSTDAADEAVQANVVAAGYGR